MKTKEASKILAELLDNSEFKDFLIKQSKSENIVLLLNTIVNIFEQSANIELEQTRLMKKTDDIAVSLKALASLSKYTKQQWVSIIKEFNLDIKLNPRASARDVLGKVLTYLDEHPNVLDKPEKKGKTKQEASNLEDTLNKLIGYKS